MHSRTVSHTCDSHDVVSEIDIEELGTGDCINYYFNRDYSISLAANFNDFETTKNPIFQLMDGFIVKTP